MLLSQTYPQGVSASWPLLLFPRLKPQQLQDFSPGGLSMKKFVVVIFLFVLVSFNAAAQTAIRINCGGGNYTDSKGQPWEADQGSTGGLPSFITAAVKGTNDPKLFQTGRYSNGNAGLVYAFNVPNGPYHVNLYFAETYAPTMAKGTRVFNVKIQDALVFSNLDVFAEAGADTALIKGAGITVVNGRISVELDGIVQNAKVNAIEILPGNSAPQLAIKFQYPDGTPVVGTFSYTVTSAMLSFSGQEPLVNGQVTCSILANPSTAGISMQFTVKISLSDSAGNLLWDMNVGMNPAEVNLVAVQNSSMTVVLNKL
jgi:hypothetical protein